MFLDIYNKTNIIMANIFNQVKTSIPNVGQRAYIFSRHINEVVGFAANLLPNPNGDPCIPIPAVNLGAGSLIARQCHYFDHGSWAVGSALENIYPSVGQFIRHEVFDSNGVSYGLEWISCDKVVEIIDEATFNTGTCVSCYNQGTAGECSNTFGPNPDPLGCFYDNHINSAGIPNEFFVSSPTDSFVTTVVDTCAECWGSAIPNGIKSCCDPTIQYTLPTNSFIFTMNPMVYVGSALVGDFVFPAGSTPPTTEYGCWEVVSDAVGPLVGTLGAGVILAFPDCYSIDLTHPYAEIDSCCPPPIEDCDSYPLQPLNKRINTFKLTRDNLLNKEQKYNVKSVLDLTGSPGDGTVISVGGDSKGKPPTKPDDTTPPKVDGGGRGERDYRHCCTWCCSKDRGDVNPITGCMDWMCGGCNCSEPKEETGRQYTCESGYYWCAVKRVCISVKEKC